MLHLNYDNWIDFRVRENPNFTEDEKNTIFEMFGEVKTFERVEFYPGVDKISRIREINGKSIIRSSSLSEEVIEYKEWLLPRKIPGITKDDLELNLVKPGSHVHKTYEHWVLIAADDNPYNIATSFAHTNMMPMWQPWSRSKKAVETVARKNVIWLPSLKAMTDYAYQMCKLDQLQLEVL